MIDCSLVHGSADDSDDRFDDDSQDRFDDDSDDRFDDDSEYRFEDESGDRFDGSLFPLMTTARRRVVI